MDIELLLLIISALLVGFIIGRFSYSNRHSKSQKLSNINSCSDSYIQGLNYLLANKSDKAIQLFVDLIKIDSDTIETHLALGNLFRTKGEVDRAIKIHQNLIAKPNLDKNQRVMTLTELAEDYLKAGLLDRAENLFKELVQINPRDVSAQRKLLELFSIEKSWKEALVVAQILHKQGEPDCLLIVTHCYCEIAEQYLAQGNLREARESLKKAIKIDVNCIRATLLLIDVQLKNNELSVATRLLKQLLKSTPQMVGLFLKPAREIYLKSGSVDQYQRFLISQYEKTPVTRVALELLESYQSSDNHELLVSFLHQAMEKSSSLELYDFAFKYFKTRPQKINEVWTELASHFNEINFKRVAYICNVCGYESQAMHWNCPSCKTWSSFKPL
ncbi:MAG: lipopolysaccharide assembly protein LapB [Gammaproteobacteria bacterium]|nr:lipopolysaccharide assembly protein LapB [Gammaproteobacteria bacterium]